jgi:hypothetical protein
MTKNTASDYTYKVFITSGLNVKRNLAGKTIGRRKDNRKKENNNFDKNFRNVSAKKKPDKITDDGAK